MHSQSSECPCTSPSTAAPASSASTPTSTSPPAPSARKRRASDIEPEDSLNTDTSPSLPVKRVCVEPIAIAQPRPRRVSPAAFLADYADTEGAAGPGSWSVARSVSAPLPSMDPRSNIFAVPATPQQSQHAQPQQLQFAAYPSPVGSLGNPRSQSRPSSQQSGRSSASGSNTKALVEDHLYRTSLEANGIFLRNIGHALPDHVQRLVDELQQQRRSSPGPTKEQVAGDAALEALELQPTESLVQRYFERHFWEFGLPDLHVMEKQAFLKHVVPGSNDSLSLSTPVPDFAFGHANDSFAGQRDAVYQVMREATINSGGTMYPFLVIECKADGPSKASGLWAATSQSLGGTASCLSVVQRLNARVRIRSQRRPVTETAFAVAADGSEARLFVAWTSDEGYNQKKVKSFALQEPDQYIDFRRNLRNIIDWGRGARLDELRNALADLTRVAAPDDLDEQPAKRRNIQAG